MFRKVTKTGPATLTIALPPKWARKHGLIPGSYVEIKELDNQLSISPEKEQPSQTLLLQYNPTFFKQTLEKLFLESIETIKFKTDTKFSKNIDKIISKFPGYKIIEQTKEALTINKTLKPNLSSPKSILRRCYRLFNSGLENNPPKFSKDLNDFLFLLKLYKYNEKEVFLLMKIKETLDIIKEPIHDEAFYLLKTLLRKIYTQKYSFSSIESENINDIIKNIDIVFNKAFNEVNSKISLTNLYSAVLLANSLNEEIITAQSKDLLVDIKEVKYKKYKIGICLKNQSNPFWAIDVKEAMENSTKDLSNVSLLFNSPLTDFDTGEQERILNKFVKEKVDGIILAPIEPKKLSKTIDLINNKSIPLIILDVDIELEKNSYKFIGFDNYKGGSMTADYMKKKLKKRSKIVILKGHLEGNFSERVHGFIDSMNKEQDIKVLNGDFQETKSYNAILNYLKNNKIDAIFATSDNMASGAIKAIKKLGLRIPISSFDLTETGKESLQNGEIISTINTKPKELGTLAIQLMDDIFNNKTVAKRTEYEIELVTSENN
ncbi:substrate-binding domain-containing protein [archaeon]|nr:substrate-binding domain-containing protein [archaeon]